MSLLGAALAPVFASLAGLVAAVDASRRGRAWLLPAIGVGVTTLAATLGVLAADRVLLSAYAAVNGHQLTVVTPLELLVLTVASAAVVAGAVVSGYGALARLRRPA